MLVAEINDYFQEPCRTCYRKNRYLHTSTPPCCLYWRHGRARNLKLKPAPSSLPQILTQGSKYRIIIYLTPKSYYNYYKPKSKYLIVGYVDSLGELLLNTNPKLWMQSGGWYDFGSPCGCLPKRKSRCAQHITLREN